MTIPRHLRDLDALARAQHLAMWQVLQELETEYLSEDETDDGDIVGRVCTFVCLMLLALLIVKTITKK